MSIYVYMYHHHIMSSIVDMMILMNQKIKALEIGGPKGEKHRGIVKAVPRIDLRYFLVGGFNPSEKY